MISTTLLPLAASAQTHLTISLYENAGLRLGIVNGMKKETSRIFQAAGVTIEWLDCELAGTPELANLSACSVDLGPARFMLQLVSGTNKGKPKAAGIAMIEDGSGVFACLYPDRVQELAGESNWEFADLLGHAAAHEIGHLILGTSAHSSAGVMRARWDIQDLRRLSHEGLTFLPRQLGTVRTATLRPAVKATKKSR